MDNILLFDVLVLYFCIRRKPSSPEPNLRREVGFKSEASMNGKWSDSMHASEHVTFNALSPNSLDYDEFDEERKPESLDRR